MNQTLFALGAVVAGFCIALQGPANTRMRGNLGASGATFTSNALYATFFSICGTFLTILLAMLLVRPPAPSMETLRNTQWWNWIGGPLGAIFVLAGAALIEHLGAALYVALVVGGQLLCSLVVDHYGLMGLPQQAMTPTRVLGAALVVAGVVCIKYL
jgi:transporter family-2 protein